MAERGILAYFHSPEQAEGVASKLKALRAVDVQVDRFQNDVGSGLDAAMADSMVSREDELHAVGLDIILAAVIDDQCYDQAVRVIETAGGTM
ncbi:hypothetical protein A8709_24655 [Paenibacillus pectinilyticus]|uniref:Uncharacterized protein n=1 Tax=Paenibacillus pectinilyticus TaxID=512399 RepID=A0A1C1A992_9BACL|nr:hypothetical protein [Paenibacillus pectinilyticus]OCT17174.1 hypothetical protein A8709_24655 [Paenibacillus pectinilyticus]